MTKLSSIFVSLLAAGTISLTTQVQAQTNSGPISEPNVKLNVQRSSGNCPPTVGLWWITLPFEGGAEHTVVANTTAFADRVKLVSASKQFIEFVSPLRSNYAACVGQTRNQEYNFYNVQFKDKKAYFRVDLRKINAPAQTIIYNTIAGSRPYVRWAIAD
ncbi:MULTISPECIES: hypothetical protein [Nostocales]|jgi:hypothetical protein|uniref:Uncharacterized protein n=1 Tax=Dolichospermum flos-aquae UHCC 0037 TaxID=2590026 RepID=A0ACC7S7R1_DOLFA|nr:MULTISPECIES: hypothetical protein [Nostocales]MCX5981584.1 hypothetical protein [Nostocales cyanobacterium LacPavin_0920_SED1_MAG_38_18]ALB42821.1 hypothetical protein AA650_22310 [Anabaena sp. WA102]MBO1066582.1 hypothetical protein [Anabaena sp. 54]MTJ44548.1 hypothetical protein [Dolichospermum flos-aquae UHCC 0037]OBQ17695.1 MAG: hypothetical protein AN486_14340 [Anabaena sp. AL93]